MSRIGIITDSHSSITQDEADRLGIKILPMPFYIGGECYYEGKNITRNELMEKLINQEDISTSQPSPEEVMNLWDDVLEEYDNILYMPLSSGLSGSYSTAAMLAQEEKYKEKVYVVDHGRISTPLHQSILDALEMIEEGLSANKIKLKLEQAKQKMAIFIAVDDLKYLRRGGRISSGAAVAGQILNIKPILSLDIGILELYKKCRGLQKAKKTMIEDIKTILSEQYSEEFKNGDIHLLAASSADDETTQRWVQDIKEAFPGHEVMCDYLSFGVTCHTGPGALGIGFSCRP